MSVYDLTKDQSDSLRVHLDCHSIDVTQGMSEGAKLSSMIEAVDTWCESMTSGLGLVGLMYLDPHDTVIWWLELGGDL